MSSVRSQECRGYLVYVKKKRTKKEEKYYLLNLMSSVRSQECRGYLVYVKKKRTKKEEKYYLLNQTSSSRKASRILKEKASRKLNLIQHSLVVQICYNFLFTILTRHSSFQMMSDSKSLEFMNKSMFSWISKVGFMGLALLTTVTFEDKVETPSNSSGLFCITDCVTCPKICSPPPPSLLTPKTSHPPPPPPSSAPPPTPSVSHFSPPPPLKSYNKSSPSSPLQPQPTVISGPHEFSYPYYYFYASGASSISIHATLFVFLLMFLANWYSIIGN
jgi:hypothetical protein